jgi:hypothetical protein
MGCRIPKSKISSCGNGKQNTIVSKVAIYARNDYVLGDTDKKPVANLRQILVIGGGLDSTLFQTKHLSKHEHYTQPSRREEHAGEED